MTRTRLADAPSVVGRIHGTPPLVGERFLRGTQIARPWAQQPFAAYTPPMRQHIIAGVFRGDRSTAFKIGGKQLREPSITGTTIINPKGHEGWWDCPGSPVVSIVYLGEEQLQTCADEAGRGGKPELLLNLRIEDPKLFKILGLIAEEAGADAIDRLFMEQLIELLCLQLLRGHVAFPIKSGNHRGGLSPSQIKRVTDYMQEHLGEDIRLQELASLVALSRFHFCRAFRRSTGHTPHQWLVRLRIRRASQLLGDTRLSVTDVALAVGYQTASSFASAFRGATGVTPTTYRQTL